MSGFTDPTEQAILENATVGLGRTLYLGLYKWTGTAGAGAGNTANDDGSVGSGAAANVAEVNTGGYTRLTITSAEWATATGTAPATKAGPKSGSGPWAWTASGAALGELCGWGLYTALSGGTPVCVGTLTNSSGTATSVTVNSGETFQFDSSNQIKVQLGDPSDTFG
jgi:hypothetical protein